MIYEKMKPNKCLTSLKWCYWKVYGHLHVHNC